MLLQKIFKHKISKIKIDQKKRKKKRNWPGLPWWSSGYDSTFPLQRVQFLSLAGEKNIPRAVWQKKKKKLTIILILNQVNFFKSLSLYIFFVSVLFKALYFIFSFKQYLGVFFFFVTIGIIDLLRANHCKKSGVCLLCMSMILQSHKNMKS